jgi:hypothetical protein
MLSRTLATGYRGRQAQYIRVLIIWDGISSPGWFTVPVLLWVQQFPRIHRITLGIMLGLVWVYRRVVLMIVIVVIMNAIQAFPSVIWL